MQNQIDIDIIKSVGETINGNVPDTFMVKGVSTDSGAIEFGALFAPITKGGQDKSNDLLAAIERGAAAALWEKGMTLPEELPDSFPVFQVENVTKAIQRMAQLYLHDIDPAVIAVTGNEGKLITKNLVSEVLEPHFKLHKVEGGRNITELSLSILQMCRSTDMFLCDFSFDGNPDNLEALSNFVKPSFSIITDLNCIEHYSAEGLSDAFTKIESGMKGSSVLVVDGDEPLLRKEWKADVVTCGQSEGSLFQIEQVEKYDQSINFTIAGIRMPFTINSTSENTIKYTTYAVAVAVHLGILPDDMTKVFQNFIFNT